MKDDLFDIAKPVRDASVKEMERVLGENVQESVLAGNKLGAHFAALCIAFTSRRFEKLSGPTLDPIQDVFAIAISNILTHAAIAARPDNGRGEPVSPSISCARLLEKVAGYAFSQLAQHEAGLQDFLIQFERKDDGSLGPRSFDVMDMLKGKP